MGRYWPGCHLFGFCVCGWCWQQTLISELHTHTLLRTQTNPPMNSGGGLSWPEPDLRLCPRAENNPKQPPAPPAGVKISKPDTKPRHTEMLLHNVECVCCAAGRPATKPFILIKVVLFDFRSLLAQSVRHVRGDASPAQWQHVWLFQTQPLFVPLFDFIKPFSVFLQQEAPVKIGLIALATRCYVLPALCLCIYLYQ